MATIVMNTDPTLAIVVEHFNRLKAQVGAGSSFHLDKAATGGSTPIITAANASDLQTSLDLCNQITAVLRFHVQDHRATTPNLAGAHKIADATFLAALPAIGAAVDLATAITAANAIKAGYGTHIASTSYHDNADGTNTIAAANATDQSSLNTLLNELKTDVNAHMASAPAAPSMKLITGP